MNKAKLFISRFRRTRKKVGKILVINKRQRFLIAILILSSILFFSEHQLGKSGIVVAFVLSILTVVLLLISNYKDIKENFSYSLFILPFFFSLAFGLFFFLVPIRYLTRIIITLLYAIGLYSLFLAQNIFTFASIRTIALLSSARIVSFVVTLLSYLFLTNVVFSLDLPIYVTPFLVFIYSFFLVLHSLWTITLEKSIRPYLLWSVFLSLCLFEIALVLGFWPSNPTVTALFLTGVFYIIVGTSQVWLERRLFRGVLLGYTWVAVVVLLVLIIFTPWGSGK